MVNDTQREAELGREHSRMKQPEYILGEVSELPMEEEIGCKV